VLLYTSGMESFGQGTVSLSGLGERKKGWAVIKGFEENRKKEKGGEFQSNSYARGRTLREKNSGRGEKKKKRRLNWKKRTHICTR